MATFHAPAAREKIRSHTACFDPFDTTTLPAMPLYSFETHGRLEPHMQQEWLLTNGLGGFSSSSVLGCNTRRYHGLLVAATLPPVGRIMGLNRIGESLIVDGKTDRPLEFSVNQFRENIYPRGDRYLRRFELEGTARWEYDVEGVRVVKEVQMLWMRNVVGIRYTAEAATGRGRIALHLSPFVSLRDFHGARRAGTIQFDVTGGERHVEVDAERFSLRTWADNARFTEAQDWWYGHVFPIETDRGLDDQEDLFTPGRFIIEGDGRVSVTLWAELHTRGASRAGAAEPPMPAYDWNAELERRRKEIAAASGSTTARPAPAAASSDSPAIRRLVHAANDFIVYRKAPDGSDGTSILAGYPWFADWGRDTFISLPGLLLVTGRFEQARQVLSVFASYVSDGMIPNRFDDYDNEPHYNTVDASLWFIHGAFEYLRLSNDHETFEKTLRPACREIIDGYTRGTRFGIRMDPADSLITQGDASTQLTWMDAKCGGIAFTPRQGKAVEINALWYHALRLMGDDSTADQVKDNFGPTFWLSPFRGLADVVNEGQRDPALRPNQIFAVSLPNSPLTEEQQHAVVEVVRRELLTPVGMRTLSREHSRYHGLYNGPQPQRDEAYHNGTIWPWPLGAFLDAYLKVNHRSPAAVKQARAWLRPLIEGMENTACIGSISEIYEADTLRPVGCPAQAWSVAEVLRLAVELEM